MYYVILFSLLYGIYLGLEEMSVCKRKIKQYHEPENILDFLLNEQTK